MSIRSLTIVAATAAGVLTMGSLARSARSAVFHDVTLGEAGTGGLNLTVFQTGNTVMSASNSGTLFNGNVGLAAGGSTNFSGGGDVSGTFYVDPGATAPANNPAQMHFNGGIVTQSLTQAVTDVDNANSIAASLTPDQTFASLGGSLTTLTAIGALNNLGGHNTVYDVTGNIGITNPSHNLTISGGANDFFIINVGGDISVSNGAILLTGGVTPGNVLFNMTGGDVTLTNASSTLNGIFLAPLSGQAVNLTPGTVNGAIIGFNIHTSSGPIVNGLPPGFGFGVPEPASLGVLGLGALALIARRRRA